MIRTAVLAGIEIPLLASLDMQQTYEPIARETIHLMGDGSHQKQTFAGTQGKVRSVISGRGAIPPGLDGLDASVPLLLQCGAERATISQATSVLIPAARRSDDGYTPWGRAYVESRWQPTAVAMTGDLAALTPVPNATLYQVLWFPEFQVLIEGGVQTSDDLRASETQWQVSLLQV